VRPLLATCKLHDLFVGALVRQTSRMMNFQHVFAFLLSILAASVS
jgi:hypothetical protein